MSGVDRFFVSLFAHVHIDDEDGDGLLLSRACRQRQCVKESIDDVEVLVVCSRVFGPRDCCMGFFVFELSCLGNGVHTNRQTLPGIMVIEV